MDSFGPDKLAEAEQQLATLGDLLPPMWRRLFVNSTSEGFTEAQAMDLLKTWILSQNPKS